MPVRTIGAQPEVANQQDGAPFWRRHTGNEPVTVQPAAPLSAAAA